MNKTNYTPKILATRIWSGMRWHYPHGEKVLAELADLRRELAEVKEACRVLAEEVNAAYHWMQTPFYDRCENWPEATSVAVRINPIASAAVRAAEGKQL